MTKKALEAGIACVRESIDTILAKQGIQLAVNATLHALIEVARDAQCEEVIGLVMVEAASDLLPDTHQVHLLVDNFGEAVH